MTFASTLYFFFFFFTATAATYTYTLSLHDALPILFPKFRGKQVLMRDENGLEKCVACGLCSVACPADAIYLEAAEIDGTVDRKSTRLNSSHPSISYAVFCLKKKKYMNK